MTGETPTKNPEDVAIPVSKLGELLEQGKGPEIKNNPLFGGKSQTVIDETGNRVKKASSVSQGNEEA